MTGTAPRVALIGCGGTISSLAVAETDYIDYPETGQKLSAAEVLDRLPRLAALADLTALPFRAVGSNAIGPADWLRLAALIEATAVAEPDLAGIVVLHGTATMEETAWFLHLVLKSDLPVVLTGAQRPLNVISSDAEANLRAAIRLASDPCARGLGVTIVMNDAILSAREATKSSTLRLQAFQAPGAGFLGTVDPDRISLNAAPLRPHTRATPFQAPAEASALPRVDVVYAVAGGDAVQVNALRAAGTRGIVSAGFAPGMPPPAERAALIEAVTAGIAVVQSSRVGSGRVARRQWLQQAGWIAADDLSPQKARILLMLALCHGSGPDWLQHCFDTF